MSGETKEQMEQIKCSYCGTMGASIHNGVGECQSCWNWRKLEGPAARYWTRSIEALFANNYGSGPDFNDWRTWREWGIDEEVKQAILTFDALRVRYVEMMRERGVWDENVYGGPWFGEEAGKAPDGKRIRHWNIEEVKS